MSLRKLPVILVIAWVAAVYLSLDLGRHALDDVDGLYMHVARQMVERHDFITPYADGVRFLDKPPLMFWLMALSYRLLSFTEFAERLPFILAVVGTAWLLWSAGRGAGEPYGGSLGALCFSLCLGTFLFTRTTQPDMLLVFFDTLAFVSFLEWYRDGGNPPAPALRFYGALAGAMLSKGLIGVVLPLGMIGLFLVWSRDLRRLARFQPLGGSLLFLGLASPWFLLVARRNPGFLWHFFVEEHVLRFLGRREPFDYQSISVPLFWVLLLVWLLPWSPFIPAVFSVLRHPARLPQGLRDLVRLSVSWALVGLAFFSVSSRLEHYALVLLPPLAILLGVAVARGVQAGAGPEGAWVRRGLVALGVLGALLGPLLVGAALWLPGSGTIRDAGGRGLSAYGYDFAPLFHLPPTLVARLGPMLLLTGVALSLVGPACWWLSSPRRRHWASLLVAGLATVFCLLAGRSLGACEGTLSSWEFGETLGRLYSPGDAVVNMGDYETANSLNVYTPMPVLVYRGKAAVLEWGLGYADAPERILGREAFVSLWSGRGRAFLLLPVEEVPGLPPGAYHEVLRSSGRVLLCNRAVAPLP